MLVVPGGVLYVGNAIAPIQRFCWEKAGVTSAKMIVDYLIKNKADVNLQTEGHATPLMIAACVGNDEIVKLLLDAKADPNVAGMLIFFNICSLERVRNTKWYI